MIPTRILPGGLVTADHCGCLNSITAVLLNTNSIEKFKKFRRSRADNPWKRPVIYILQKHGIFTCISHYICTLNGLKKHRETQGITTNKKPILRRQNEVEEDLKSERVFGEFVSKRKKNSHLL